MTRGIDMPDYTQFQLKLFIYSHAPKVGDGILDYTEIPYGSEDTLINAYKIAYACVDSIEGLITKDQEAHRLTIWQGEQIVASADLKPLMDEAGQRYFTTDSLIWQLPPTKTEVAQITEELEAYERLLATTDADSPTAKDAEVRMAGLRNQLNFSACPIARTTLQTTLYRAETEFGLRSSITRHFEEDLNL
jgi:hypothetical protein